MATNITTENLLGQFCSLINTNAAGVANVDDLFIYKYSGGTVQRITAQLMRDYILAGLRSQTSGYATQDWVDTKLLSYVGITTFNELQATVNQIATIVNQAASKDVFLSQAEYDALESPDESKTYFIYEE